MTNLSRIVENDGRTNWVERKRKKHSGEYFTSLQIFGIGNARFGRRHAQAPSIEGLHPSLVVSITMRTAIFYAEMLTKLAG